MCVLPCCSADSEVVYCNWDGAAQRRCILGCLLASYSLLLARYAKNRIRPRIGVFLYRENVDESDQQTLKNWGSSSTKQLLNDVTILHYSSRLFIKTSEENSPMFQICTEVQLKQLSALSWNSCQHWALLSCTMQGRRQVDLAHGAVCQASAHPKPAMKSKCCDILGIT